MIFHADKNRLAYLASQVEDGVILEIGSLAGESACAMASATDRPVYCIDLWDLTLDGDIRTPGGLVHTSKFCRKFYQEFIENTKGLNVTPIKGLSEEIAKVWSLPLGLLFIDGDHSYQGVKSDYESFSRFIIPGGYLVFHDYDKRPEIKEPKFPGVIQAVDEIREIALWEDWQVVKVTISARRRR